MALSARRRGADHRDLSLKRVVDAIKPGPARFFVWDATEPGFGVDVWPTGTRTWVLIYRANGVQRRMKLGSVDEITPDAARKKARAAKNAVDEGRDPLLERRENRQQAVSANRARRDAPTFADVAGRYLETLEAKRSARWAKEARRILETDVLPRLGHIQIASLSVPDVERLHEGMRDRPFLANRAKAIVSSVVAKAIDSRERPAELPNPAHLVEAYEEPARERSLSPAEWKALAKAWPLLRAELADVPEWDTRQTQLALLEALALTGARVGALIGRAVKDVDLESRVVKVQPAHKGVNRILLGSAAVRALAPRLTSTDLSAPLFPGQERAARAKRAPLAGVVATWNRLRELAGVEDVRLHDLRKSFASVGVDLGYSTFVIGGLLGHSAKGVTERHYTQRPDALLLAAADQISEEVAKRLGLTGSAPARRKK